MTDNATDLLRRRDLMNFVQLRNAHPGDDLTLGDLLVRTFRETYARKLPSITTASEREMELRDISTRRRNGLVRIMELGFQIIGTYALIVPETPQDDSWTKNTGTLRCVAIDPRFHSLRLSEQLIEDAVIRAVGWRLSALCLHVQDGAEGVARLYERFGFRRDERGDRVSFGNKILGYHLSLETYPRGV